jgi:cyanophycinase
MPRIHLFIGSFILLAAFSPVSAQPPRIDPAGIGGALLLCGDGEVSQLAWDRFVELAGGAKAKVVVVVADEQTSLPHLSSALKKQDAGESEIVHLKDVAESMRKATGVWLGWSGDRRWTDSARPNPVFEAFADILRRGGVVASSGSGAELIASRRAFNLLPGGMVERATAEQGGTKRPALPHVLPGVVGFQIERGAALLLQGRTLSAVGDGKTIIHLAASKTLPARQITLQGKKQEDLTALRRAAFDRVSDFPPPKVETPIVEKGTLVIVGGGGMPDGLFQKIVEYAGGAGKANIVIFPTAAEPPLKKRDTVAAAFRKAGANKATLLYGQTLAEVESKKFLDTLKEATGLWFDGGRQWRFVDCYENTKTLPLMFDVLARGGVIGGTSAGATIQGEYLCRGGVFNNFDIRYPGYERSLGFLKGVAIDQHFTQRKRQGDMTSLMKTYPQYLGIGLDESTAIVVQGQVAEVVGHGKVHFYDAQRQAEKGQPDFEALSAGARYDLKQRKILTDAP